MGPAIGPSAMLTYARTLLEQPNFSAKEIGESDEDATLAAEEETRKTAGIESPQKLYHYTSKAAMASISQTFQLRESSRGIAGVGIYATSMHPTNCTREQIERNN